MKGIDLMRTKRYFTSADRDLREDWGYVCTIINHTMYYGPYRLDIEILADRYEEEQKLLQELAQELTQDDSSPWEDGKGY